MNSGESCTACAECVCVCHRPYHVTHTGENKSTICFQFYFFNFFAVSLELFSGVCLAVKCCYLIFLVEIFVRGMFRVFLCRHCCVHHHYHLHQESEHWTRKQDALLFLVMDRISCAEFKVSARTWCIDRLRMTLLKASCDGKHFKANINNTLPKLVWRVWHYDVRTTWTFSARMWRQIERNIEWKQI